MKKIFIEDGLCLYNKTGIGQYTQNLADILKELDYKVIMPRKIFIERIKNASVKRVLYVLWLNIVFPVLLIFSGCEKVIFTNYLTPLFKIPTKKYYPVIHDLWAVKSPDTMSEIKRNYQTWILKVIKKTYYKIITVSNTVKHEISDYYNCPEKDIEVIYNYFSFGEKPEIKLSKEEQNKILTKYNIETKKYILSVGSLNKRKNIQLLIDAYNKIDTNVKLVIVGKKETEKLNNTNQNIIFTGYINDEELKVLYKNTLIFVFPSIYEGFGIPLIDAQSFGVPVLCSDISVFREIGGDSVIYTNTKDLKNFSNELEEYTNKPIDINFYIEKGKINCSRYSKTNIHTMIEATLR